METALAPFEVAALLSSRRSIHRFDPDRHVPPEVIDAALEVAVQAPNHKLTEPWRFYVLGSETRQRLVALNAETVREKRGEEAAANKYRRWQEIPHFVVVTCRRSGDAFREREDYAACACAVQNLVLYLWSAGVGTKWTTGAVTRDARFYELIGADPEREDVVALLQCGFPLDVPEGRRTPAAAFVSHLP